MTERGQQIQSPKGFEGQAEQARPVPQDRAGVMEGAGADIVAKYTPNKRISITEIVANKQRKKQLYVANVRKNPVTKKTEYQLKETSEETNTYYSNDKWYPEKEVRLA